MNNNTPNAQNYLKIGTKFQLAITINKDSQRNAILSHATIRSEKRNKM